MTPIEPTAADLMEAIALLIMENDALRISAGKITLSIGRRTFDREELERGRQMSPQAFFNPGNCLVVKVDS